MRALILAPSRELAFQTFKVAKELAKYTDLRIAPLVGGESMEDQFATMTSNPDVYGPGCLAAPAAPPLRSFFSPAPSIPR